MWPPAELCHKGRHLHRGKETVAACGIEPGGRFYVIVCPPAGIAEPLEDQRLCRLLCQMRPGSPVVSGTSSPPVEPCSQNYRVHSIRCETLE